MGKIVVLFNSKSGNGRGMANAQKVKEFYPDDELEFIDVVRDGVTNQGIVDSVNGAPIVLCGGDGTLNHFINEVDTDSIKSDVYFFATGTGNDFLNDLGRKPADGPVKINEYIINLPVCTVKGKTYKFINGIGYGIDGYCCEVGDKLRKTTTKPINYAGIAIKGLLFHYKPTNATITVDGKSETLKKVWLCPIMFGRYYGGGMIATPNQDRKNPEHTLSSMAFVGSGRLSTLIAFPSIFKGEHINKKMVKSFSGYEIKVAFDRPVAAQVDGETILDVSEISARFR